MNIIKKYITATAIMACGACLNANAQVVYVEDEEKDIIVTNEEGD